MKLTKSILTLGLLTGLATGIWNTQAADEPAMAASVKPYPLNYCVGSGEKFDAMGKTITTNYMGQEIKFCCKDCVKDFQKDPDAYLKKVQDAAKKAAKKADMKADNK